MFGGGHYGTVRAHSDRWQAFVKWCRSEQGPGINDARQIDRKVLADYAAYLRDIVKRGDLAVSTAQNRLSSVNRTMEALRGDQYVKLPSPSKALGMQRTGVRQTVPQGQGREQVKQIVDVLCRHHQLRAAAIVLLARATGMRLREAILADLPRLSREAEDLGRINIQDGTKGGRAGASAPRWIAVDHHFKRHLGLHGRCRLRVAATWLRRTKATGIFCKKLSALRGTSCMHTTSKASMSYERRTRVSAMSKLL